MNLYSQAPACLRKQARETNTAHLSWYQLGSQSAWFFLFCFFFLILLGWGAGRGLLPSNFLSLLQVNRMSSPTGRPKTRIASEKCKTVSHYSLCPLLWRVTCCLLTYIVSPEQNDDESFGQPMCLRTLTVWETRFHSS